MKTTLRTTLFSLVFVISHAISAQNNAFVASTTCGPIVDIEPVDNGYMLLSQTHWAKLDSAGKVSSSISFNLGKSDIFEDARFLSDKGFIAVSHISHNVACVVRLDSNGNEKWVKSYTLPNNYDFQQAGSYGYGQDVYISLARNGGYWLTGNLFDSVLKIYHGLIIKLDTGGNILSSNMVMGDTISNKWDCHGVGPVVYGPDGANYFSLIVDIFEDGDNGGALKTDSSLNIKWTAMMDNDAVFSKGMLLYKNQLYFAGSTYNDTYYQPSISINAYDTGGNWTHELSYNLGYGGNFNSICATRDSQLIATGNTESARHGYFVPMLVKTDLSLNLKWMMAYPTYPAAATLNDYGYDLKETRNGYVLGGTHIIKTDTSGHSGCNDSATTQAPLPYNGAGRIKSYFLPISVIASNASVSSTVIADKDSLICYTVLGTNDTKPDIKDLKIFPNPSNGKFTFQFTGITPIISIEIFNLLGERISVLKTPKPGDEYNIDLSTQPGGIYFYRVSAANGQILGNGKLSLIR